MYVYTHTHTHTHTRICILFQILSVIGDYKIFGIVPCAISRSLVFILYIVIYISYSQTPTLSLPPLPLW